MSQSFLFIKSSNQTLDSFNVLDMKINLLLKNVSFSFHFNVEIVPCCFYLEFKLSHFLLKLTNDLLSLLLCKILSKLFHSFWLCNLKIFEFLSVVLGFFNSLIYSHQFLLTLHLFKLCNWFNFDSFNSLIYSMLTLMSRI